MPFSPTQNGASAFSAAAVTSRTSGPLAAVSVGQVIWALTTYDDGGGFTDTFTDDLGNTYSLIARATNATSQQGAALYRGIVTVPGTPTLKQQYNPTPGTSTGQAVGFCWAVFDGADLFSATDGAAVTATPNAPGAGADALSAGSVTPAVDGALLIGGFCDCTTNNAITAGTGFTSAASLDGGAGNLLLRLAYLVQASHAAKTITATAGGGATDNYVAIGVGFSARRRRPPKIIQAAQRAATW